MLINEICNYLPPTIIEYRFDKYFFKKKPIAIPMGAKKIGDKRKDVVYPKGLCPIIIGIPFTMILIAGS